MPETPLPPEKPQLSSGRLLRVWLGMGMQSFGGGMATLALLRKAAVDEERWLTEAEFARFWSLVQLAPGINLLALTILVGRKTGGIKGIALALFGLLLPSVTITLLLTAGYAHVQQAPLVREALRGIVPAVVGLGLVTAWQIARPPLMHSRREGAGSLGLALCLLVGSGLASGWKHWPVLLILLLAGSLGAAGNVWRRRARGAAR